MRRDFADESRFGLLKITSESSAGMQHDAYKNSFKEGRGRQQSVESLPHLQS